MDKFREKRTTGGGNYASDARSGNGGPEMLARLRGTGANRFPAQREFGLGAGVGTGGNWGGNPLAWWVLEKNWGGGPVCSICVCSDYPKGRDVGVGKFRSPTGEDPRTNPAHRDTETGQEKPQGFVGPQSLVANCHADKISDRFIPHAPIFHPQSAGKVHGKTRFHGGSFRRRAETKCWDAQETRMGTFDMKLPCGIEEFRASSGVDLFTGMAQFEVAQLAKIAFVSRPKKWGECLPFYWHGDPTINNNVDNLSSPAGDWPGSIVRASSGPGTARPRAGPDSFSRFWRLECFHHPYLYATSVKNGNQL